MYIACKLPRCKQASSDQAFSRYSASKEVFAFLQIQVQIGGQAVPNSPCTVSLRPGPVCIDRLQVEGANTPFMAGEEKTIDILTVDAHGHATAQDAAAKIIVEVASGTCIIPGNSGHGYSPSTGPLQKPFVSLYAQFIDVFLITAVLTEPTGG